MSAKLGTGTYTWSTQGVTLEDSLPEIAALGIRYVDVSGMDHGDPTTLAETEQREVKAILDDLGLIPCSLLAVRRGINLASADPAVLSHTWEYFRAILDFASVMGTRQICLMAGEKIIDVPDETAWANAVRFSKELAGVCRERDMLLTYELEWRTCGLVQTVNEMARLIAEVDEPNVLANLDVGHAALARDGMVEMRRIGSKTIHLHLNDNDTVLHTNSLPGEGQVPIAAYLRELLAAGAAEAAARCGEPLVAGIEIEDSAGTGLPARDLVRRTRDWVAQNLPEIELT